MNSAKASNFSIDHIMGFPTRGNGPSYPTSDVNGPSYTNIHPTGDFYQGPATGYTWYPGLQTLVAPTSSYLQGAPYQSTPYDYCSNGYFDYAPRNCYPVDANMYCRVGRFSNVTAPQSEYAYLSDIVNPRKRSRIRTVFTENQIQKLERLFSVTDYPGSDAREELARKAGLSAETVRVWFKNRRARRKRQIVVPGKSPKRAKWAKRDSPENNGKTCL